MTQFNYTVKNAKGETQTGIITAHTKQAAVTTLQQKGFHPLVVRPSQKGGMQANIAIPGTGGVKSKEIVVFTRQFATMISAGVPIVRAMTTLKDQAESPMMKKALAQVVSDIQGGMQLSDAFAKHPKIFSDIYVNMVRAGEAGGILDQILNRLALQVEKDTAIKSKFKGAMIYPAVVCSVAVLAVIFLMVSIIPKLTSILVENGGELPPQTKLIIAVSDLLINQWPLLIGSLAGTAVVFKRYTATEKGKYQFHKLMLKAPVLGKIIMKVNIARFARTFSSLLGAGVSVIEALETTAGSLSNVVISKALMDASKQIQNGTSISDALGSSGVIPEIIIQMAAVGEETGKMDTVLNKVAEFYEDEVDTIINSLSSIIEPILIVGLGGIVGFIVASVLGPITALQGSVK